MTQQELDSLNVGDIVYYNNAHDKYPDQAEPSYGFIRAITNNGKDGRRKLFFVQYFHNFTAQPSISLSNMQYWGIVTK